MGRLPLFLAILLTSLLLPPTVALSSAGGTVVVVEVTGVITHATFELVKEGFDQARSLRALAVILALDTPGGLWEATESIVRLIDESPVPVISFVPMGKPALSAGTIILLSSHLTAMAPMSIIGACQPRAFFSGEPIEDPKVVNALRGFLAQRAEFYGRNRTLVEEFVTKNHVVGAREAREYRVVEFVASSIEELLRAMDGVEVKVRERRVTLKTRDAAVVSINPSLRVRLLSFLSDPLISRLLFILGLWGMILSFMTVGYEGEILAGILLILGLIGMGFHVDLLALFLLILGAILLFLEVREPGLQILGPAGIICILLAFLLTLRMDPTRWLVSPEWQRFFTAVTLAIAAANVAFAAVVYYALFKSEGESPKVLRIVGETAVAIEELTPGKVGFVKFRGEYWKAVSTKPVAPGQKVKITGIEGLTLIVEPI